MSTKIKHMAIVSQNYAMEAKFFQALFGMKVAESQRPEQRAMVVSDGYVGMNINGRAPGRQAGFDHFGFEVDDVEIVFDRLREKYPSVEVMKRPGNRPFAGLSLHDPAGNVFDLSQRGMENRRDVYEEGGPVNEKRYIKHFALRAVDPTTLARFYREVLQLLEMEKPADDPNSYLTDGRVTLVVCPWKISDFKGSGIERPALDHIGFKVESLEAFKADLDALVKKNPSLMPAPLGLGPEGEVRKNLLSQCKLGKFELSDLDGVLIDVAEN